MNLRESETGYCDKAFGKVVTDMRITMVSNYINHHQLPFSDAMYELCGEYCFVQTMPMEQKRIDMG